MPARGPDLERDNLGRSENRDEAISIVVDVIKTLWIVFLIIKGAAAPGVLRVVDVPVAVVVTPIGAGRV